MNFDSESVNAKKSVKFFWFFVVSNLFFNMLGGPESHVTFLGVVAIVVFKFPNSVPAEFETPGETSTLFFKKYFLSYLFA
jgi:hypothetical protein